MEKIRYTNYSDCANPDTIRISEWGVDLYCQQSDAIPIIYTNRFLKNGFGPVLVSNAHGMFHSEFNVVIDKCFEKRGIAYITSRNDDAYLRIWTEGNAIACWDAKTDIKRFKSIVKDTIKSLKSGNYTTFSTQEGIIDILPKEQNNIQNSIDFDKLMFYWTENIEDEDGYNDTFICRMPVSELFQSTSSERTNYYKEGEKAWVSKHGDIDPAMYHLLMYQEGKETKVKKLDEKDVRKIVSECIKKIINKP